MLLSRTADNLFWMARYIERAERIERLLDVGRRMASLLPDPDGAASEWASTIEAAGCEASLQARYRVADAASVIRHLVRDADNPSSIVASLGTVRSKARAVRTALSADVWDAVNSIWIETQALRDEDFTMEGLPRLLDWVKERSQRFGGAVANTMLGRDAYWWVRLGTFLERAKNTVRLVDVKCHVLLPRAEGVGRLHDYYQCAAVLRAVSALRAYHWGYRDRLDARRVAERLILRSGMPRSLLSCTSQARYYLERIRDGSPGTASTAFMTDTADMAADDISVTPLAGSGALQHTSVAMAPALDESLQRTTVEEIFAAGLHEYLTEFITATNPIGIEIRREYL
ncbi:MAG: alpha-E domain-containing protein [Chloroflexi bacterium]|nr:alpha-E domain-containing protein [Chloroflexota bacterium]